jgi:hypothetical protein
LLVLCKTNLLSLISQYLDNNWQIQTKCYSILWHLLTLELNKPQVLPWFVCSAAVLFGCLIQNRTVACKKVTISISTEDNLHLINCSCIGWKQSLASLPLRRPIIETATVHTQPWFGHWFHLYHLEAKLKTNILHIIRWCHKLTKIQKIQIFGWVSWVYMKPSWNLEWVLLGEMMETKSDYGKIVRKPTAEDPVPNAF